MDSEYICPVCRDTGIVWSSDPDGESMYQSACPERIHDAEGDHIVHYVRDPEGDERAHG